MTRTLILALAGFALLGACLDTRWRWIDVDLGALQVSMGVRPMLSLQSDWERRLVLRMNGQTLEIDLPSDTGWWRGSSLYLLDGQRLMLDEGQAGVLHVCLGSLRAVPPGAACASDRVRLEAAGAPSSRKDPRWRFLGHFGEGGDPPGPLWRDAQEMAEPDLPDPL